MQVKNLTIPITIYVDPNTKQEFKDVCDKERRSMSSMIRFLMDKTIEADKMADKASGEAVGS